MTENTSILAISLEKFQSRKFQNIHLGENITVDFKLTGLSKNNERWKIVHQVFNEAGKLSATVKIYGAWIDLTKRKLAIPPKEAQHLFDNAEKSEDFEEITIKG